MDKKENSTESLSFEKNHNRIGVNDNFAVQKNSKGQRQAFDKKKATNMKEISSYDKSKKIIENGNTFIDITEKYVTDYIVDTKSSIKDEEEKYKPQTNPVVSKKRVKTFNEIFASFFGVFFPVKGDNGKEVVRKIVLDFSLILIVCCVYGFAVYFIEKFSL